MTPASNSANVRTSDWGGLSDNLIAKFFAVQKTHNERTRAPKWVRAADTVEVWTPLTEGQIESTQNWNSPFENVGPDQAFSSLSAMVQSGALTGAFSWLGGALDRAGVGLGKESISAAEKRLGALEGRSNLTKLNSTQIFSGSPPLKISVTAHFRAYADAIAEVEEPINQLMEWSLPQKLAGDGLDVAVGMFPSSAPQVIGMKFGRRLFMPLVIESIGTPLTAPMNRNGVATHTAVSLQLSTLTALDRNDWIAISAQ